MTSTITHFDPANYLDREEVITEYLSQVLEDGDTNELLAAIGHVARARGMAHIAQTAGLGKKSLLQSEDISLAASDNIKEIIECHPSVMSMAPERLTWLQTRCMTRLNKPEQGCCPEESFKP
ncbi:MAG: putative addiction module antidote protein [Magnetococcales bacterium]|nr:putative addiction module antidote protein [Magnetococcales bacterium]